MLQHECYRAEHASAEPQHGEIFLVRGFLQSFAWQVYVFVSVMIAVTTHATKILRGFELAALEIAKSALLPPNHSITRSHHFERERYPRAWSELAQVELIIVLRGVHCDDTTAFYNSQMHHDVIR
jgi:hypothetical protein